MWDCPEAPTTLFDKNDDDSLTLTPLCFRSEYLFKQENSFISFEAKTFR
jgi:hypothetical protein